MNCKLCDSELTDDNSYFIELAILKPFKIINKKRVTELCNKCINEDSISTFFSEGRLRYTIRTSEYEEKFLIKQFKELGPDYIDIKQCLRILKIFGINKTSRDFRGSFSTTMGKLLLNPKKVKINPFTTNKESFNYYLHEKEVLTFASYYKRGKFIATQKHSLNNFQQNKLIDEGWALKKGDSFYLFDDKLNKKRPCKTCGEIKNTFEDFYTPKTGPYRGYAGYECKTCESDKSSKKYANLPEEKKEKHRAYTRQYRKDNIERCREYKKTPAARIYANIRKRLKDFMKTDYTNFNKDIGCTHKELIEHIESQFEEGMNWDNYGSGENGDHVGCWHIDHIIPISKLVGVEGARPNHYLNLRPMWGIDNLKKSNKLEYESI